MTNLAPFSPDPAQPLAMLAACPASQPTPLNEIALEDGRRLFVKYEGGRMNVGSFKGLGGVYAIACLVAEKAVESGIRADAPADLQSEAVRGVAATMTFVCASAGNHGLSVATGARLFGARSVVHLAATVPESFARRLEAAGAQVRRSGATYEDAVAAASAHAATGEAILVADGSWPGYTRIPSLIMEGYTVLAHELQQQLEASGAWPGRVFLQAGVGGLAAAVAYHIRHHWPVQPQIVVVEPDAAPCLKASRAAGKPVTVAGPVSTMGRLDCKDPSLVAFDTLRQLDVSFAEVSDAAAEQAAKELSALGLATTPSGAAGFAALKSTPSSALPDLIIVSEGAE